MMMVVMMMIKNGGDGVDVTEEARREWKKRKLRRWW